MKIQRLAAFADGNVGGNPAGVVIDDEHPAVAEMQAIAAQVGYSETAFAMPAKQGWRVRYFSPESEVAFCGHATIALGAALAGEFGAGIYPLELNAANISVEGIADGDTYSATLQSPETSSTTLADDILHQALALFGYSEDDLDPSIAAARANAGAEHLLIALKSREALSAMAYDLAAGRDFMRKSSLVTVMFAYAENDQLFHSRNPFASGGVYEDPATGAASAAFAGYLRDIKWPHGGEINIVQGEDMGARSLINAQFSDTVGESIRISGSVRRL